MKKYQDPTRPEQTNETSVITIFYASYAMWLRVRYNKRDTCQLENFFQTPISRDWFMSWKMEIQILAFLYIFISHIVVIVNVFGTFYDNNVFWIYCLLWD